MIEDAEVDNGDGDYKNEMVKRLPFKNLNKVIGYLSYNIK